MGRPSLASAVRSRIRGRRERRAELPAMRAEDEVDPRGDLARNAGVASFGLNLPWRRPRGRRD
ncbi:MAG TPA: hypothetical protein VH650_07015 [Gaiellaceae bacterium]